MKWIILFASIFRTNNDNLFSQQPLHDKAFDLDDFRESLCLKASREPAGALLRDPSRVFRRLISVEGRSWWRGPDRLRRTVAAPVRICRRRRFRPTEAGVSSRLLRCQQCMGDGQPSKDAVSLGNIVGSAKSSKHSVAVFIADLSLACQVNLSPPIISPIV